MKKLILLIYIGISTLNSTAQSVSEMPNKRWSIGLDAGANLLPNKDNFNQTYFKTGLYAGVNSTYTFSKTFSVNLGLTLCQKGSAYSYETRESLLSGLGQALDGLGGVLGGLGTGLDGLLDSSLIQMAQSYVDDGVYSTYRGYNKVTYAEIPLLAEISYHRFKFAAGPYLGMVVSAQTKETLNQNIPFLDLISPAIDSLGFAAPLIKGFIGSSYPGYKTTALTETSNTDKYTQWNYGYLVKIAFQIYPNTYLEARYSQAMNTYLKVDSNNKKLTALTVNLKYNFGLKK